MSAPSCLVVRSVSGISSRYALLFLTLFCVCCSSQAALLDVWRAEDLNLNDGDVVGSWASASNRVAGANVTENPILKRNATPAGGKAVRFTGTQRMSVSSSPVGGASAFSMAIVFKVAGAGAND